MFSSLQVQPIASIPETHTESGETLTCPPSNIKISQIHPITPFLAVSKWSICDLRVWVFVIVSVITYITCMCLWVVFCHFSAIYYYLWIEKFFHVIISVNWTLLHFKHPYWSESSEKSQEKKGKMLACIQAQADIYHCKVCCPTMSHHWDIQPISVKCCNASPGHLAESLMFGCQSCSVT